MKEAISENIKRAQIINNQLERKMLSTRKMLEKEKKSPGLFFKATFLGCASTACKQSFINLSLE